MRKHERRVDARTTRIVIESVRLAEALGREFGRQHLEASLVPDNVVRAIMAIGFDRRERQRPNPPPDA
jgi:hypothetical protein